MREKCEYEADGIGYSDATSTDLLGRSQKTFSSFSQVFLQVYLENQHFWKDGY